MKIPERYCQLKFNKEVWSDSFADSGGHPTEWPEFSCYPPPGFLPIHLFDYGNGDISGFYWPVGREATEPLLCETYHDEGSLEPVASTLEGMIKIKVIESACKPGDLEYSSCLSVATQLGFKLPQSISDEPPTTEMHLSLDPFSPVSLRAAAKEATQQGHLDLAEDYLMSALTLLPEYTSALCDLASLYRRKGQPHEAARTMIETLSAPLCFGVGREKCLQWLRRMPDVDAPPLADDPLWQNRHRLTFATGVKRNDDFDIYEEAITEYQRQGKGVVAVRLRLLVGELMWTETHSFRERYDYTMEKHKSLLVENVQQAGLSARLPALK